MNQVIVAALLSWGAFMGKPVDGPVLARSYTAIVTNGRHAWAEFDSARSWTRTRSDATLRHESVHWAITQHWARLLDEAGCKNESWHIEQWGFMEERYDLETDHGRNEQKQQQWEQKWLK